MDPAYFVGRKELLAWINDFLVLDYTKVEQMASGAAYVQLMDAAFPGQIPLSKVNFNARFEYEFCSNLKILQNHFVKIKCDKVVPTDRLIKAKYQDNLEFMQWMKRYFEMQYNGEEYDAVARRKECKCEYAGDKTSTSSVPKTAASSKFSSATSSAAPAASSSATPSTASDPRRASMMPGTGSSVKANSVRLPRQSHAPARSTGSKPVATAKDARVEELTKICAEMTIELTKSETTQQFYYGKLRAIETLLSSLDTASETTEGLRDKINAILFTEEAL